MHEGSALSPLLFVIVMETISREFKVALPWELLYADDLVVIAETEEDLIKRRMTCGLINITDTCRRKHRVILPL